MYPCFIAERQQANSDFAPIRNMKLKQREKILIFGGAGIIVMWLLYSYVYLPKRSEGKRLGQEIGFIDQSIKSNREIMQNSKMLEAEIEQLQQELGKIRAVMGGKRQIFQVMEQLEEEPFKSNIKLVSIQPLSEETKLGSPGVTGPSQSAYTRFSIDMKLECRYKAIGPYLEALESLPMLITIQKVSIEGDEDIYPNLTVNLVVSMYSLRNLDITD